MLAGQTLKNSSGNEVILFPLEYMYITQTAHDVKAIDVIGYNASGRVYNCSMYAPVSCYIVYTGNDHNAIFWSNEKVYFADGTTDYLSILTAHSETAPTLGASFSQGQEFYQTGNYGQSRGDHCHIEFAKGHVKWNSTGIGLQNAIDVQDAFFINDTVIVNSQGLSFKTFESNTPNFGKSKYSFLLNQFKRKEVE